jgi:plastocyanin
VFRARARLAFALALTLVALGAGAADAGAANRRVAIGDYRWSQPELAIDLGEHVTWYWVGPDTMHSVTGTSQNAIGIDTDPDTGQPRHQVGDTFALRFDTPGTYTFQCKLHSSVRGTVVVSSTPGDPSAEPDPVPETNLDLRAPTIRRPRLASKTLRGRGGQLRLELDERSKLDADYYRLDRRGRRDFEGYAVWRGYIGLNEIRFGARAPHFRARPGRYVALLRATDRDNNISDPREIRFRIRRAGARSG